MEFELEDVAKRVAETMNNSLFGKRLLKCHFMPPEKVHKEPFREWHLLFKNPFYPAGKLYNTSYIKGRRWDIGSSLWWWGIKSYPAVKLY